jgi:hypothetical protein
MMKKTKRYEDGGYLLDSEGNRVKSGSGEYVRTGSYDKEADMESARNKLAGEVQEMVKPKAPAPAAAPKASDGMDESDRRREAAESAPKRQDSVKTKPSVVTKPKTSKPAGAPGFLDPQQKAQQKDKGPYRDEGRNRPAPAAPAKKPEQSPVTAFPINPGILKQREEAEKKRDAARAAKRKESEAKEDALKKKREEQDKMSPGQRSAARGKALKEFFGMAKGGSVRGSGIAQRGVRKCKMV